MALSKHVGEPVGRDQDIPQNNLYFMWSLERVAVLYDLATIGDKDWYRWGAEMLVANQKVEGNWENGGYHGADAVVDTCLALLFLKRANLVSDLTTKLPFDPNALSSSIKEQLTPKTPDQPASSPADPDRNSTPKPADPPPAKTTESEASIANTTLAGANALTQTEPPPASQEEEKRESKAWLWLLVGLALLLFIACGILLASYSFSRDKDKERPRRVRYGKNRLERPHRPPKHSRR